MVGMKLLLQGLVACVFASCSCANCRVASTHHKSLRVLAEAHDHGDHSAGHGNGEDFVSALHTEDLTYLVQELYNDADSDLDFSSWLLSSFGCVRSACADQRSASQNL